MIHQAIEDQVTWLPGISYADIPRTWPSSLSIKVRSTGLGIEPQGVVGAVPLLNGDTIQISPKIGQVNFFRLFIAAGGMQQDLGREFEQFVSYSLEDESNIDSLVARQLLVAALDILRLSPMIGRVLRHRRGLFAAGRLDARATSFNIAAHTQDPVVFWVRERTNDIPENRVLSEAIVRAFPLLSKPDRDMLANVYQRWLARFPRSRDLGADLEHVSRGFAVGQYGGGRDYYRRALMLADVVLGNHGLGFGQGAVVEGDSALVSTADVFERYLRNVIARSHAEFGYVVSKGDSWTVSLYTDGSRRVIPDIVVSRGGSISFIADAKYKNPDSSDHYQMYAYLHVMDVEVGLLLAPSFEGNDVISRRFSSSDGKVVWEVRLPLSNFPATEAFLKQLARNFGR